MKAHCKRLAGRSIVIGATNFSFNTDGICETAVRGRPGAIADFNQLCKLHGVTEIVEGQPAPVEVPPPAPVKAPEVVAPVESAPVLPTEEPQEEDEPAEEEVPSEDPRADRKTRRKAKNRGAE